MLTMMMNPDPSANIAAMLAEDTGAPELRSPLNSGMQGGSLLGRFVSLFFRSGR